MATSATTADARAGYEIYRRSDFSASRSEINQALSEAGYAPISDRMYRHYRRLAGEGYNRYISINRFDVAKASEPYEDLGNKSRYQYLQSGVGVRVTFPRGRRLVEAYGRADRVGETGMILVFDAKETVAALTDDATRPRTGDSVRLDFLDPPSSVDGTVMDAELVGDAVVLEVDFTRLESISQYIGREPLPVQPYQFRLVSETDHSSVDVVGRQLYGLFEFVEASRAVVNELSGQSKAKLYAPVSTVSTLSMRSPLLAIVLVPEAVAMVGGVALSGLGVAVAYERWRGMRLANNSVEIDNEVKGARAELDKKMTSLQGEIIDEVAGMLDVDRAQAKDLSTVGQLARVVRSLAEHSVQDVQIEAADDPPSASN